MAVTAAVIGAIAAVAGTATAVAGASRAQKVGENNAELAEYEAEQARQTALINAEQQAITDRKLNAAMRARFGAAGTDIGQGSAAKALTDSTREGELDRQRILAGGDLQSVRLRNQARAARTYGQSQAGQGYSRAASGFISSGLDSYNRFDKIYDFGS